MKVEVIIPNFEFDLVNERKTVEGMAEAVRKGVKRGTRAGVDAHGRRLPPPKDGGKAYNRTGTLLAGIRAVESKRRVKPRPSGKRAPVRFSVYSVGPRPKNEDVKGKKKRARTKQKQMRAAAIIGEAFGTLATGRDLSAGMTLKKRGKGIRVSRIRVRAAATNQAVAAILSTPPKDLRSRNGNRRLYRVFEPSLKYERAAQSGALRARGKVTAKSSKRIKGKTT